MLYQLMGDNEYMLVDYLHQAALVATSASLLGSAMKFSKYPHVVQTNKI
jgi:hypothetical protein